MAIEGQTTKLEETVGEAARSAPGVRERPVGHSLRLHLLLFGLTAVSALVARGRMEIDLALPWGEHLGRALSAGGMYAGALMAILFAHEMGHYLVARRHGVEVSLPYFLPAPPILSLFGTFGAFIRMPRRVGNARALIDIGLAGPLAGLVVALPLLALGLSLSPVEPLAKLRGGLFEGNSLLYLLIKWLVLGPIPPGHDVSLHPIAWAGWVGLLVTSLNLLPVGQLDGGHIAYPLFGPKWGVRAAWAMYGGLIALALGLAIAQRQFVWVVWAVLIGLIGVKHPPLSPDTQPLDRPRKVLGYLALLLFALTFTPIPLSDTPAGGWGESATSHDAQRLTKAGSARPAHAAAGEVPDDAQVPGMRSADPPVVQPARSAGRQSAGGGGRADAPSAAAGPAVLGQLQGDRGAAGHVFRQGRHRGRAAPARWGHLPGVRHAASSDAVARGAELAGARRRPAALGQGSRPLG